MVPISRRKFIVHSAHTTVGVSAGWAALQLGPVSDEFVHGEEKTGDHAKPLNVCLASGSLEYFSDASLAAFQAYVEKRHPIRCTRAFMKTEEDLPGLENLGACDCMLLFTRRLRISGEQLNRVKQYCQSGRAIVGVRTASHAFQNWLALDKEVFGGDYQGHYGNAAKPQIGILDQSKAEPVLEGIQPFVSGGSLYKNPKIAPDATVLLTGTIPGHAEPVAWTRVHRGGRVFYTSLGHPDDFRQTSFLRLLTNALFWATKRSPAGR